MRKAIVISGTVLSIALIAGIGIYARQPAYDFPLARSDTSSSVPFVSSASALPQKQSSSSLPARILIQVPFVAQAPFGKWDALHQEACEEMSLILVRAYRAGECTTIPHFLPLTTDERRQFSLHSSRSFPSVV